MADIKLTFLGTRGEIEEYSKKHKYHSSLLIEYKKFKLLIDYGTLQKYTLERLKPNAIIITHAHPDHYVWTVKNPKSIKGIKTQIPVYLTKETLDYGKFKPENPRVIKSNKKFRLGPFSISPFRVIHSIRCPGVGFKISVNKEGIKKRIIYTGDVVDIINKNKILRNIDYYIGDGSSIRANLVRRKVIGKQVKFFGHARITTQINWCKKAGIEKNKVIFTHLGKETIREEKIFKKKHPGIILAYDGRKMKI